MPILAGLLSALFGYLFDFFAKKLAFNIALASAIAATMVASVGALYATLHALWAGLSVVTPSPILQAFAMVMPGNTFTVLSAVVTAQVVRTSFDYWLQTAGLIAGASK